MENSDFSDPRSAHGEPTEAQSSPAILRLVWALPSLLWFGWFVLDVHLGRSRPHAPDDQNGLVHPQTEHGVTIYLSSIDSLTLKLLFWAAIVAIALPALLDRLARQQTLPSNSQWLRYFDTRTFKQSNGQGLLTVVAVALLVAYLMYG